MAEIVYGISLLTLKFLDSTMCNIFNLLHTRLNHNP